LETCEASKQPKASSTIHSVARRQTQTHTAGQAQQSCPTCSACVQKWALCARCARRLRCCHNYVCGWPGLRRHCIQPLPVLRCGQATLQALHWLLPCSLLLLGCLVWRCQLLAHDTVALLLLLCRPAQIGCHYLLEYPAVVSSAVLLLPPCRRCSGCVYLTFAGAALAATLLTPAHSCALHCAVMPTGHSAGAVLAAHLISAGRQAACSGDSRCTTTNTSTNSNTSARQDAAAAAAAAAAAT
jgi:hypothetical protein